MKQICKECGDRIEVLEKKEDFVCHTCLSVGYKKYYRICKECGKPTNDRVCPVCRKRNGFYDIANNYNNDFLEY